MSSGPIPSGPRLSNQPLARATVCPRCRGTGYEIAASDEGVDRARRCTCRWADKTAELLKLSRIPRRYQSCSFESYDDLNASLQLGKRKVRKFVDDYPIHDFGLLLLGPCGVGKTHLAAAALLTLIRDKGVRGLFYDFRDLLKEVQASYNSVSGTTEMAVLQPIFSAEILVLDDLGATRMTEWVRDTLSHIIANRYNDRQVTIFTCNLEDEKAPPSGADDQVRERANLRDRIGDDLRSRLYEMCEVIQLAGEDYRYKVKHTGQRGHLG